MALIKAGTRGQPFVTKNPLRCHYCHNSDATLFHTYFSHAHKRDITYCRLCTSMQYASDADYFELEEIRSFSEELNYTLGFDLTAQQAYASQKVLEALSQRKNLLLYAVTGAGKTEMILAAIQQARKEGLNVALVSPRVDVVKELALRMNEYFDTEIDVLYGGSPAAQHHTFVIATLHQLFKYRNHFGLLIIDEVDAFPLPMDQRLMQAAQSASAASIIYLTATPPKRLLKSFDKEDIVMLPARYHRRPLIVPELKFMRMSSVQKGKLYKRFKTRKQGTYLLVFFPDIMQMLSCAKQYSAFNIVTVSSEDELRHDKVEAIRRGEYDIIFTTTILERGFTMASLDVWIMGSCKFSEEALIQMSGRVDRKKVHYDGEVIFFHEGVTFDMLSAIKQIKRRNQEGRDLGWVD